MQNSTEATKNLTKTSEARNEMMGQYYREKLDILKETNELKKTELKLMREQNEIQKEDVDNRKIQNVLLENISTILKKIVDK